MATGHKKYETKSTADMYEVLGERDTAKLYSRSVKVDTTYDIPYAGGNSVDGKTVYIDRELHQAIKSGEVKISGIDPRDLIQAIVEHEHSEWAIDAGDNPVDTYGAAHEFATAKEHKFVTQLGVDPDRYEEALKKPLSDCVKSFLAKGNKVRVPRDLWCGPYLDDPDENSKKILRTFVGKGVEDASKISKFEVHYGIGPDQCRDCAMFNDGSGPLRKCDLVSGLVRNNRWCKRWVAA